MSFWAEVVCLLPLSILKIYFSLQHCKQPLSVCGHFLSPLYSHNQCVSRGNHSMGLGETYQGSPFFYFFSPTLGPWHLLCSDKLISSKIVMVGLPTQNCNIEYTSCSPEHFQTFCLWHLIRFGIAGQMTGILSGELFARASQSLNLWHFETSKAAKRNR